MTFTDKFNESIPGERPQRGTLVIIGGAEDKLDTKIVLKHFVQLAGGDRARIVILPTATGFSEETGQKYKALFLELGAARVEVLYLLNRVDANNPVLVHELEMATAVFLTGGNQVRLSSILGGTKAAPVLRKRYMEYGLVVGGTSAGASAMSKHMIVYGRNGNSPHQRMVQMGPGLGLIDGVLVDQHFSERGRIGRLITAVAHNPEMLGIGVDEDTAAIVSPNLIIDVIGTGSVTIVDGSAMTYTNIGEAKGYEPLTVLGLHLDVLSSGFRYDLNTRQPIPGIRAAK